MPASALRFERAFFYFSHDDRARARFSAASSSRLSRPRDAEGVRKTVVKGNDDAFVDN